jgi:hypothetical protein
LAEVEKLLLNVLSLQSFSPMRNAFGEKKEKSYLFSNNLSKQNEDVNYNPQNPENPDSKPS